MAFSGFPMGPSLFPIRICCRGSFRQRPLPGWHAVADFQPARPVEPAVMVEATASDIAMLDLPMPGSHQPGAGAFSSGSDREKSDLESQHGAVGVEAPDDALSDDDVDSLLQDLQLQMQEDSGPALREEVPDQVAEAEQPADASVRPAVDVRMAQNNPPPPPLPPDPERIRRAREEGSNLDWNTFNFGAFKFTAKKPKTSAQWSWQVKCPFHRKSNKTDCKKTMNVTPATPERYHEVLRCLKHWCNSAKSFDRQRHHLAYAVGSHACPSDAVIAASVIPAADVPDRLATDEELDARERELARAKAKAKSKSQAKAKQKAKAKAKAKGKGSARGHEREARIAPSDEAASDPSSDSSNVGRSSSSSSSSSSSDSDSGMASSS